MDDVMPETTRRLLSSTDAQMWAEEFTRLFAVQRRVQLDDPERDEYKGELEDLADVEGLMIGWFANAIEVGREAGKAECAETLGSIHKSLTDAEQEIARLRSPQGWGRPRGPAHDLGPFIRQENTASGALPREN